MTRLTCDDYWTPIPKGKARIPTPARLRYQFPFVGVQAERRCRPRPIAAVGFRG
jgi:hypothetical protein